MIDYFGGTKLHHFCSMSSDVKYKPRPTWWSDFISLWYPNVCAACQSNLIRGEYTLCTLCKFNLPRTGFHHMPGNMVEKLFWGKINFERATSFLFFHKFGVTQQLIHLLKYKNRTDIGTWLGREMGNELKHTYPFNKADLIIPVPLHHAKQRKRGYNQSDFIAEGLSEVLKIEVDKLSLLRLRMNESQTRKSRMERWKNVDELFDCTRPEYIKGKRILLVDDVLTTGATLEACALALYEACPDIKINFITAALAHH